ncbi:hypothetical protein [Halorubrum sp. T3]|uniref:hypothetical protein n=1 Tax=Halorubrum sp. T3 TaxID=1194088 RepID=UPI00036C7AFB|nr:hypothetical protein [Halorubrum sp. T3]
MIAQYTTLGVDAEGYIHRFDRDAGIVHRIDPETGVRERRSDLREWLAARDNVEMGNAVDVYVHEFIGEEVALTRRRVVAARGTGRDPGDALGRLVETPDALREDADGGPVVPVRLLAVVLPVDPADDSLGGVAIVSGVGELVGRLIEITANSFRGGVEGRWFSRPQCRYGSSRR